MTVKKNFDDLRFIDTDLEIVPYDGSHITFRPSVYAVIIQDSSLLIIKNKTEKLFDIPGGGINIGERLEVALKRECLEEAGASIIIGELITYYEDFFYHREEKAFYQAYQLFFKADLVSTLKEPLESNIDFARFIPISELRNYPLCPGPLKALEKVGIII